MKLRPLGTPPTAVSREEDPQSLQTASAGRVTILPNEMRAAQAGRALTTVSLLSIPFTGGGKVSSLSPHGGSTMTFNEYQRAVEHAGDPVRIRLRRSLGNLRRLVVKIECDTDEWPESPFESLVIKQKRDNRITLTEKGPEAHPAAYGPRSVVIDGRDVEGLSRHADTLVPAGFLLDRAVGMIYDSQMAALSPRQEPASIEIGQ